MAPRVLVITEDDDLGDPLQDLLARAGYAVEVVGGAEGVRWLKDGTSDKGPAAETLPEALVVDSDLRPDHARQVLEALAPHSGRGSFPLVSLGGSSPLEAPAGWHEDALASLPRPPHPAEIVATLNYLRRLVFYRRYRDLVHDLAQPVTTLHALGRSLAKLKADDEEGSKTIARFILETERLMSLMEEFQRGRAG